MDNIPIILEGGRRIDKDTGLELCESHYDRIKHFFCMAHRDSCCRMCSEILHNKNDCMVVDLYVYFNFL